MEKFLKIMDRLLGEGGCPWDRIQTHESLRRYLIEESYEVVDAIDKGSDEGLKEELGDVLLQVVFHSKLAEKEGKFDFDDVVEGVSQKMISRHPHVFGDGKADNPDEVLYNWEEIKKKEKGYKSYKDSLESVPKSLPALMRAEKLLSKGKKITGEDYETKDCISKAIGLLKEIEGCDERNIDENSEKIGEILMEVVKISKKFKINPEFALTNQSEKFITILRQF